MKNKFIKDLQSLITNLQDALEEHKNGQSDIDHLESSLVVDSQSIIDLFEPLPKEN